MNHVDLSTVHLEAGGHNGPDDGMCVMELVSLLARQPFSDAPPCVSPILRDFAMRWNDDLDDTTRQRLVPYAPRMVGTAGDGHDERRAWLLVDWQVRTFTPAWLRLAGLTTEADRLAGEPEIVDHATLQAVQADLEQARSKAAATRDAARAATWAAARDAARDALQPTVAELQESAFALLDRLIDPTRDRVEVPA